LVFLLVPEGRSTTADQQETNMPLTDVRIRSAKPTGSIVKLSDGEGLQLWVTPAGGKIWKLAFRVDGKQKTLTIGPYPHVSLQDARGKAQEAKRQLAAGADPAQRKQLDKLQKALDDANTFALIAAELLEKKKREGRASATIGKREWLYALANADLGNRAVGDVTAPEVLAVLRKVEKKGLLETAHRLRSAIGEVFRYAIATGRATNDPTYALRGALTNPTPTHRAAITEAKELGALMRAIEGFQGQAATAAALKLLALLFPRPGELRMAEWNEFDMGDAVWTIPAARTKMRKEHRVPLPRQALAILEALKPYTSHSAFVFPHVSDPRRCMSENTLNAALRRMGYAKEDMSAHGFRAAASTLLNESNKFSPDAIERALAHQDPDEVRRAYARGAYWQERVTMGQWWADHLDALRDGAKVIPLARA
jgi:integrase